MITVDIQSNEIGPALRRLQARLGNLSPALAGIGQELENRIKNRFESHTDPSGAAWIGWADSTIKNYPADANRRLLDRYGDMLGSLSWQIQDSASVAVGFGQPYAAYHEFGTTRMPRRGLLTADPEAGTLAPADEQAVLDVLYDLLDAALDGR